MCNSCNVRRKCKCSCKATCAAPKPAACTCSACTPVVAAPPACTCSACCPPAPAPPAPTPAPPETCSIPIAIQVVPVCQPACPPCPPCPPSTTTPDDCEPAICEDPKKCSDECCDGFSLCLSLGCCVFEAISDMVSTFIVASAGT